MASLAAVTVSTFARCNPTPRHTKAVSRARELQTGRAATVFGDSLEFSVSAPTETRFDSLVSVRLTLTNVSSRKVYLQHQDDNVRMRPLITRQDGSTAWPGAWGIMAVTNTRALMPGDSVVYTGIWRPKDTERPLQESEADYLIYGTLFWASPSEARTPTIRLRLKRK